MRIWKQLFVVLLLQVSWCVLQIMCTSTKYSNTLKCDNMAINDFYLDKISRSNSCGPRDIVHMKNFFVITAIFNPASYKSRYNLYHNFVKHMNETGAQLITIECIFPSLNQTEFQVTEKNNPWHIQLKSDSIYWMKENLINIAVSRLPPHAKWISWLDADIDFEDKNWVELTIEELKKYSVVQMFEKAKFLGPSPKNEVLRTLVSFGYSVVYNKSMDTKGKVDWYPHPGYGWAMSVKDFQEINGLPDYNIVGSGDRYFAYTLINKISQSFTKTQQFLPSQFTQMAEENSNLTFHKLKDISRSNSKKIVGYVPTTIKHNWHGSRKHRQYHERWNIFTNNNYNFLTDVTRQGNGLLQFNSNKSQLQADIASFFQKRQEDGSETDLNGDSKKSKTIDLFQ